MYGANYYAQDFMILMLSFSLYCHRYDRHCGNAYTMNV